MGMHAEDLEMRPIMVAFLQQDAIEFGKQMRKRSSSMSNEAIFAQGMFIQERKQGEQRPDFILGKFSFKVDEFIAFLQQHRNQAGYVNVDLKESKGGKKYLALNDWKPQGQPQAPQQAQQPAAPQQPQQYQPQQDNLGF